jgi:hypothetical protein
MQRFDLNEEFSADCVVTDKARAGQLYHVARNSAGGATFTPIARYFVWRPKFVEGFNEFWRVDCFVRPHALSPDPMDLGESLVVALVREGLCEEPIWMSAHRSEELEGKAFGNVFSD